ncbi:MAG: MmgE/PrpD family protein [Betaproteobacteria bacterium]|jgi:2-methylcitrate dehydratase PrpD|nr:MmgE/PrpD family protein [Betaproteobacteria bacterium]
MTTSTVPLVEAGTKKLADFSANLQYEHIPHAVVERMKMCVLDSIGCCLHGVTLPWTRVVEQMVMLEAASPVATILGTSNKTSVANAALVNGTAGHAFEFDDMHKESILHPGSIAIPVLFALAEQIGNVSGKALLTAMVAGYEVGTRVGNAASIQLFFDGFHPQGTSGVFVGAAAAGRMLDLNNDQMLDCLGIAGSQAGGLMAAQEGAMVKRFHSGKAAQSGVYSALLAQNGLTGISNALEAGYGGYLSTYSSSPKPERLLSGLGDVWEAEQVGFKPYACVTSIHSSLDALLTIMSTHHLKPKDIASINVGLSPMTYTHCAWEYKVQGVTAAQMNLYFNLASVAFDGMLFVDQYSESKLADPKLLAFMKKIYAYIDEDIEAMGVAYRHASKVKVTTTAGMKFEQTILDRRGSPENPLSKADIQFKFKNVVIGILSNKRIDEVIELVDRLETLSDVNQLMSLLAPSINKTKLLNNG